MLQDCIFSREYYLFIGQLGFIAIYYHFLEASICSPIIHFPRIILYEKRQSYDASNVS